MHLLISLLAFAPLWMLHFLVPVQSCLPVIVHHTSANFQKNILNSWDLKNIKRKVNKNCECGHYNHSDWNPPWNVYVHMDSDKPNLYKSCIGTIIASNMVATSHQCLVPSGFGKRMRVYDWLKPSRLGKGVRRTIASPKNLLLTDNSKISDSVHRFPVVEIHFNPQFAISSERRIFPDNDLVLLKIKGSFSAASAKFTAICIPKFKKDLHIGNVTGMYYGHSVDSHEPDDPFVPHFATILEKRHCFAYLNVHHSPEVNESSFDRTLCFMFGILEPHTKKEGGPLVYFKDHKDPNEPDIAHLMGVANRINSNPMASGYEASTGQDNAYFSSIETLIRFIEHYGNQGSYKSEWCTTPPFLPEKVIFKGTPRIGSGIWPWDTLKGPIERDEVLDCLCGVPNSKLPASGRIVGGQEVSPDREYGWMAVLLIKRGKSTNLCGGSIIANRLILTAAHCILHVDKSNGKVIITDPDDIDVTLNAHQRRNDNKGKKVLVTAVLFHPAFQHAALKGYNDHDVALLVLRDRLEFNKDRKGIRPICLPKMGNYTSVVGQQAKVVGWGYTTPADSPSPVLRHLDIPIIPLGECESVRNSYIPDNFLCAGYLDRYRDAAAGDSGGPLMIQDPSSGRWTKVGIVSHGIDKLGSPTETAALYSDVQKDLPFIDFHAKRVEASWCKS